MGGDGLSVGATNRECFRRILAVKLGSEMTRLFNEPAKFAEDGLCGFVAANGRYVQQVHGGAVRSTTSPAGEPALIVGGGSGHYPAFAGWVGPGMAHGAACGNVFASPSASQVYSVAKAAENGGGLLIAFGNYAGDVLHFGQAAQRLRGEGHEVRIVTISDDVASNTRDKPRDRRGVAGDLPVLKITGAAIAAGATLDEAERIAWKANDATRTLGVAFAGCTLPGADHPLFTVLEGRMGVGLGIHGEPGVREEKLGTAAEVADLLIDGVLAEEPERTGRGYAGRVAVILNGLGTIKYEELFVVYVRVAERLGQAGLTPVMPEVGEFVTSLDMAGLSLTLVFLDDELEQYWTAPVDTPAFRRGAVGDQEAREQLPTEPVIEVITPGTPASQAQAGEIVGVLRLIRDVAAAKESEWGDIDAIAGDGDHGQGMAFGSRGALEVAEAALAQGSGARSTLVRAGAAWAESAGGTSGALWGSALTALGGALSDETTTDDAGIVAGVLAGAAAIRNLGGAQVGDKTMVDALVPFETELETAFGAGATLADAWRSAAEAATAAAAKTAEMVARLGRSRVLGQKSLGTPDPGATSFAALMTAIADHLAAPNEPKE